VSEELRVLMISARKGAIDRKIASFADVEMSNSVEEAQETLLTREPPDVIFLEAGTGRTASQRIHTLRELAPEIPILMMANDPTPSFLQEAVSAGAVGVVGNPPSADQLRDAIEVVRAGGSYIDPAHTKGIFEAIGTSTPSKEPVVTNREMEVLRLLFEGLSARQIASRLGLSERTVNTHVANLYRKLGASNRIEAIRIAMRMRILSE
jgi:DNA-binding NarL/FixJ family response regulator